MLKSLSSVAAALVLGLSGAAYAQQTSPQSGRDQGTSGARSHEQGARDQQSMKKCEALQGAQLQKCLDDERAMHSQQRDSRSSSSTKDNTRSDTKTN